VFANAYTLRNSFKKQRGKVSSAGKEDEHPQGIRQIQRETSCLTFRTASIVRTADLLIMIGVVLFPDSGKDTRT
jgi:hypothetical protein